MLDSGAVIVAHLVNPREKFWGVLHSLAPEGVILQGISLAAIDDWMRQLAKGEEEGLGLSTMFFPLFRIERLFLDEEVGAVPSYRGRFESIVGTTVEEFLGLEIDEDAPN